MGDAVESAFGKGQTLFRQGDKGGELFFIKTGKVELSVRNDAGEAAVVAVVGDRSVLGTMSFLEGDARSATAKCLTDVTAVVINQQHREKLLKTVPAWFSILVKDLSSSLRRLNVEFAQARAENEVLKKRLASLKKRLGDNGEEGEVSGDGSGKASA